MTMIEQAIRRAKQLESEKPSVRASPTGERPDLTLSPQGPSPQVDVQQARRFPGVQVSAERMERHGVLLQVSDNSAIRAYKILRSRVLQRMRARQWYSCGVTAAAAGEGKTLTAINLALAMAQDVNTTVFLVDMDLHRPKIAEYFGMSDRLGLSDYLKGKASFEEIVCEVGLERLAVIPNFATLDNASELLGSPRMAQLIESINAESPRRIVIYDLPPILMADDVLVFSPRVDAMMLIMAEGKTDRGTVESLKETLSEMNLLGVIMNYSSEHNDLGYY